MISLLEPLSEPDEFFAEDAKYTLQHLPPAQYRVANDRLQSGPINLAFVLDKMQYVAKEQIVALAAVSDPEPSAQRSERANSANQVRSELPSFSIVFPHKRKTLIRKGINSGH